MKYKLISARGFLNYVAELAPWWEIPSKRVRRMAAEARDQLDELAVDLAEHLGDFE